MSIVEKLKSALQNISGKTVSTGNTIETTLEAFNNLYTCEVTFTLTPTTATLVVEDSNSNVLTADANGKYHLKEGSYTYSASADGYVSQEDQSLTITNSDESTGTKSVSVTLTAETAEG